MDLQPADSSKRRSRPFGSAGVACFQGVSAHLRLSPSHHEKNLFGWLVPHSTYSPS